MIDTITDGVANVATVTMIIVTEGRLLEGVTKRGNAVAAKGAGAAAAAVVAAGIDDGKRANGVTAVLVIRKHPEGFRVKTQHRSVGCPMFLDFHVCPS